MTDFVYTIKAHPTTYAGVNFRSRLEATWAAFFDLCGWEWEYEPFDLEGWVPDFVLERRVAVEVKPIFELSDLPEEYLTRMKSSGWVGPIWVFGATVETKMTSQIGWHISGTGSFWPSRDHKLEGRGDYVPFAHPDNKIILDYAGASGSSFGGAYEKLEAGWAEAKNITQWKRA